MQICNLGKITTGQNKGKIGEVNWVNESNANEVKEIIRYDNLDIEKGLKEGDTLLSERSLHACAKEVLDTTAGVQGLFRLGCSDT